MSEILRVVGGNFLEGKIVVSGSKNSTLPILAASVVVNGVIKLENVPNITDCHFMTSMFTHLGGTFQWSGANQLKLFSEKISRNELLLPYVNEVRASILFLAGLASKFDKAKIKLPGGDRIGPRPINFHCQIMSKFGFHASIEGETLCIQRVKKTPRKVTIHLPYPSVGATEQGIIVASSTECETTILNCAVEPEINDLISFLQRGGAKIRMNEKARIIHIEGKKTLSFPEGELFKIQGDRMEFITFLILGAVLGVNLEVFGVNLNYMNGVYNLLKKIGVEIHNSGLQGLVIRKKNGRLSPFNYVARPYPSLPTDAQPIFAVLASQCEGLSKIRDTVFPHRFGYLSQLAKFGLKSIQKRNYVIIDPDSKLQPAKVSCQDIRSAASLLICALMCSGESFLEEAHHLRRGYDSIDIKLRALGADVYFTDVKMDSPKN